jgi:hypothetical protein
MRPTQKAAIALIAGAIIHAAGGIVGQVVQASTLVSDDQFSYPWTSAELVAVSLAEAVAFALGLAGVAGLRASRVAGPTRAARTGLGFALAGSALFIVAELASSVVRDQHVDEGAAGAVGAVFGLATLLLGAGLAAAGVAARRARLWEARDRAHAADAARRHRHGAAADRDRSRALHPPDPRRRGGPARGRHPLDRAALTAGAAHAAARLPRGVRRTRARSFANGGVACRTHTAVATSLTASEERRSGRPGRPVGTSVDLGGCDGTGRLSHACPRRARRRRRAR